MIRRHLAAAVALLVFGLAGPTGAAPSFGPFPSYVDDRGVWVLLSNAQWNASATTKAKEIRPQPVLLSPLDGSEKSSLVWAPSCTHDAQRILLTRRVDLPGRPASVMFNLYPQTWVGDSSTPVLTSVVLVVNGHAALTVHSDKLSRPNLLELQLPAAALGLFRLGENVLEVEVAKRALPASVAACNRSPRTLVGVAFGLRGASAADLSVDPGKAPVQYVRGSVYRFDGTFTVRNDGPSAALGGAFAFRAQIGFLNGVIDPTVNPPKATAPFGPCTAAGGPEGGPLTVTCPFTVFPPGATATVSLTSIVKIPADESLAGVYDILADWSIASFTAGSTYSGTRDPQPSNNTQSEVVHLCGPQATDPRCPAAPGG